MSKKKNNKKNNKKPAASTDRLSLGKYNDAFELLEKDKIRNLEDSKSVKKSSIPIKASEDDVYVAEPDGKLIPDIKDQHRCDYLVYCLNQPQVCFIELKGKNISAKESYNPYDQIGDTINFLKKEEELKSLVGAEVEKHAFIVSPGSQKLPKGVETKERQLWQKLAQPKNKSKILELVHYVKVTKSDRYSNNGSIICSAKSPVVVPFKNSD